MRGCGHSLQRKIIKYIVFAAVFAAFAAILVFTAVGGENYALASTLFVILMLVPFFLSFERCRPGARDIVPIAILSAIGALGRVLFAPFPSFKPTSAVVIIAGIALGPQAGFVTGAAAALASNFFFGQGPFTVWQMFAWGLMGFVAGLLEKAGAFKIRFHKKDGELKSKRSKALMCLYGAVASLFFGWIMDSFYIIGYLDGVSVSSVLLSFGSSLWFDVMHAGSTVIFLFILANPWLKILLRVREKYGIEG